MKQLFKKLANTLLVITLICQTGFVETTYAQRDSDGKTVELNFYLEDPDGKPVKNAVVIAPNGNFYPAEDGLVTATVASNATITINAYGYKTLLLDLQTRSIPDRLTLFYQPLQTGKKDVVKLPMQMETKKRFITGAVSTIEGEKLISSPEPLLSNTLQGHGLGLVTIMNAGGMSNNPASLFLRGLPRDGSNGIITVVDGIERPVDHIMAQEIESIELLKDATTKILYGPRAANGVLMITTKRGDRLQRRLDVNVDYGVGLPTRFPEFIDAYEYANLFNEARINDGFSPVYTSADIDGYRNSSGENDLRYPNADYYAYFLRDYTNYAKISTEFSGGGDNSQYFLIFGYTGARGLENVGVLPQNDRINLRGNLDLEISNVVSAHMDIAGRFEMNERASLNHAQFFNSLSTHRPNEYPFIIGPEYLPPDTLGNPPLGASFFRGSNLYGDLEYSGYHRNQYFSGQSNFGIDFNFNDYIQGLSAKAYVTFDNYFFGVENLNNQPSMYTRHWIKDQNGADSVVFNIVQRESYNPNLNLGGNENLRNTGLSSSVNYNRTFGNHFINADLGFLYALNEQSGQWVTQDIEYTNTALKTTYAYRNRYIGEFALAYMGSNKFTRENRYQVFPAGGIAWILSEEDFFDFGAIDYMKVKASAGILGYDAATSHWLYRTRWQNASSVSFGNPTGTNQERIQYSMLGNPGLEWEKSREINAGFEAIGFDHRLWVEMNYFNEYRYDIIHFLSSQIPSIYGSRFMHFNWGEVENQGIEAQIRWSERRTDLHYAFGVNYLYSENKVLQNNEVPFPDEYRRTLGLPSDAMMGYVSQGLFGPDVDIDGHPLQTFGPYGIGDIAYADLNNDGVIDDNDRQMLGNSFPRHVIGVDVSLNYKGWGLYALGTAHLGVYSWLNNSYYWNHSDQKYSALTRDRYHSENNPAGTYPRLTTTTGNNNFRDSDFWLENTSFFRLKNLELSYTFNNVSLDASPRKFKVYVRGTNLFVLSEMKDLDPEALNGGLGNYPVLTSLSLGVSVAF